MIGRRTRIHPGWHGAALQREEGITAGDRKALTSDITAGHVAIHGVEAIKEAAVVIAVDAVEVIRGCAARKALILEARPDVLDEWHRGHQALIIRHLTRRQARVKQPTHLVRILLPRDSGLRILEVLQRR